jgi:hypothetical protein
MENNQVERPPQDPVLYLRKWFQAAQVILFTVIMLTTVVVIIHNVFAPPERDIPEETVLNLLKVFPPVLGRVEAWPNVSNTSMTR